MYYTQGEPGDSVAPDVFVAFGVKNEDRLWYKVWEQRKAPDFVVEVASDSSALADLRGKKDLYQRLGVREYCVYDPQGGLHWPRLQLFERGAGCLPAGGRARRSGAGRWRCRARCWAWSCGSRMIACVCGIPAPRNTCSTIKSQSGRGWRPRSGCKRRFGHGKSLKPS